MCARCVFLGAGFPAASQGFHQEMQSPYQRPGKIGAARGFLKGVLSARAQEKPAGADKASARPKRTRMSRSLSKAPPETHSPPLELLLFRLGDEQLYGINVYKVTEVVHCPPLRRMPGSHEVVAGIASLRGHAVPVIDLGRAIGQEPTEAVPSRYVILTEFSRSQQGMLVSGVERIISTRWEEVRAPPGKGGQGFVTAMTSMNGEMVEILDVERVLAMLDRAEAQVPQAMIDGAYRRLPADLAPVLVVDDSSMARSQVQRAIRALGLECVLKNDGREALEQLRSWAELGALDERVSMLISDIEMPEMDGYELLSQVRQDGRMARLKVLLHSSLSGRSNEDRARNSGADRFLAKFHPEELAAAVIEELALPA